MQFYRLLITLVLSLLTMTFVPLCLSSTIVDRHHPDERKLRIEINDGKTGNNTLTLTGGQPAGNADFPGVGNGGFFYSPPPPWGGGGGRPSGLFEIDLTILQPVISWLMSIGKGSVSFEEQQSPTRLQISRVNADGSASEAAIPLDWLNLLDSEQLSDVDFWDTLLQRAATHCPASDSLQAANEDGQPSGSRPTGSNDATNQHQKKKREASENRQNKSPGEGNDSSGDGNNRKDDNGRQSKNNALTQNLQVLANELLAIIESDDPNAAVKFREMLDKLEVHQRVQVLETKGTNVSGNTITPLEAILALPRSSHEHSTRNQFIKHLIKSAGYRYIMVSRELPMILSKILQDIIHKVNESDQQPPIGHFEKCCFAEYFIELLMNSSNPVERIRRLLEQIPDLAIRNEIINDAQSLIFPNSFVDTVVLFGQRPSFRELMRLSEEVRIQAQYGASEATDDYMAINAFGDNALRVDKEEPKDIISAECTICQEQFVRTSNIVKTPCNHLYHVDCLNQWLKKRKRDDATRNCPTCRTELYAFSKKLNDFNKLLKKYDGYHSLAIAKKAVNDWKKAETSHEALYHFVQFCRHTSQASDDSQFVKLLRRIFHPVTKAEIRHHDTINSATFSANNHRVVTASDDGTAKIYVCQSDGSWKKELTIRHDDWVTLASFSADSRRVLTASNDGTAKIHFRKENGSWQEEITIRHHGPIHSASFSADNSRVLTASSDGTAKIHVQKESGSWEEAFTINHEDSIYLVSFSADGSHVVTVSKDNVVKITGKSADGSWQVKTIAVHKAHVNSAIFSPNNRYVVTASDDGTAKIIGQKDDKSWEEECTIGHIETDGWIISAAFSPDSRHVVTVSSDYLVKIIGKRADGSWGVKAIITHSDRVHTVTFSPDSHHVVTASFDQQEKIYGEKSDALWEEEITIRHNRLGFSTTFSPNSRHAITTSDDGTAKTLSYKSHGSWEEGFTIDHPGPLTSVIFSADGRFVMTFGFDGIAKLTQVKGDGPWEEMTIRHPNAIRSASFSADSRFVLTQSFLGKRRKLSSIVKITELWKEE
ncbi:RING finger domain-containing protein [Endozoicomonas sp. 4G]|uniref:RING finger domain-containing protein n=1 Tax=Endozoicomonas sp. 4G TaxID=2872754 RepID=UPI002078D6B0|nr:RING finger domain-containing protein [Endozoicomonas sp. 4G]